MMVGGCVCEGKGMDESVVEDMDGWLVLGVKVGRGGGGCISSVQSLH